MSTSISDKPSFREACRRAALENFDNFKRDPAITEIVEHVTHEDGEKYLALILQRMPWLLHCGALRENDKYGCPFLRTHGTMEWIGSSTTLRYIFVLGNLIEHFGSLLGMNIAEVGGGYGGQALIIKRFLGQSAGYRIFDLPEAAELQQRYAGVRAGTLADIPTDHIDLVISNYAFSEMECDVQRTYIDRVFRRAKRGYVTCNFENAPGRMTWAEMAEAIPGSKRTPHEPYMGEGNFLWTW